MLNAQSLKRIDKKRIFTFSLMAVTAVLITVFGIVFKQKPINMLPLYVSLAIGLLLAYANRFGTLLGSFNAIIYAIVYFSFTLYANAAYALLVSAPLQFVTFLNWSRRKKGNTTSFRRMSNKVRLLMIAGMAAAWTICYFILALFDSDYMLLDNTATLLGVLATVLMMFSFIEYAPLMLLNNCVSIVLYATMIAQNPAQITYLIFTIYSTICNAMAVFAVAKHYKEQHRVATETEAENETETATVAEN